MKISQLWEFVKSPGAMAFITILSLGFAIFEHYYERKPILLVKTEAISRVFNVLQPVGGLQISYAGQDLRNSKQSLWVITASVSNNGSAVIKKIDYDDSIPFGLLVNDGKIVEAPNISSENTYLQENLMPSIQSSRIVFAPVILEPRDSFRVRILVLGPEGTVPFITGFGKIGGLPPIEYATPDAPETRKSVWAQITEADATWVHFVRPIVYGFAGIFGLALMGFIIQIIVAPISGIIDWKAKQDRRKQVVSFKPNADIDWEARTLGELYIEMGRDALVDIKHTIDRAEKRCQLINEFKSINNEGKYDQMIRKETPLWPYEMMKKLINSDLLKFEVDLLTPIWSNTLVNSLEELATHLAIDLNVLDEMKNEINMRDDKELNFVARTHKEVEFNPDITLG